VDLYVLLTIFILHGVKPKVYAKILVGEEESAVERGAPYCRMKRE